MKSRAAFILLACVLPVSCTSQKAKEVEVAPVKVELPELEQACSGKHLDLVWAAESKKCDAPYDGTWLEPEEALKVHLEPPILALESGASAEVDYVISNPTEEAVTFDFPSLYCYVGQFEVRLFDAEGARADLTGELCRGGGGCSMPNVRLTLEPGGDVRMRFTVNAETREMQQCKLQEPTPLTPATYTLKIARDSGSWDVQQTYASGDSQALLAGASGTLEVTPARP